MAELITSGSRATPRPPLTPPHTGQHTSMCPSCRAHRAAQRRGWTVADAMVRCDAGCNIARGVSFWRDLASILCDEHAPRSVTP